MKKLILINPAFGGIINGSVGRVLKFGHPSVFSILEAMTPSDWEVRTYNQPFKVQYEKGLVGITCFTSNAYSAYKYADKFRKAGAKVVIGGPHVMFRVKEALKHCDSVLVGEAEGTWRTILSDYLTEELKPVYYGESKKDFWKYYHKNFLKLSDKKKYVAIQPTRGCKFNCKFCMIPVLYDNGLRQVPIDKVVEQIKSIKGYRKYAIIITDNNLFADSKYCKNLFRALIPLKIKWMSSTSIDIALDEEALRLAKKSGCRSFNIGFETINEKVIAKNPGKLNLYKDYLMLIKRIKKHKIKIKGTFIIGFDEDTYSSLWKLFIFTLKANLNASLFSILTPFPGTQLFEEVQREGRITSHNWTRYNAFNPVFKHKHISKPAWYVLIVLFRISFLITTNLGRILLIILLYSILNWFYCPFC